MTVMVLAVAGFLSGCWSAPDTPVNPQTVVGEYVFHADDSGAPHDPDRLTLRADGTYVLLHMPDGRPGSEERGKWQLFNDLGAPAIAFANFVHPILVRGKRLRLLVSDDLAQWYEKVR